MATVGRVSARVFRHLGTAPAAPVRRMGTSGAQTSPGALGAAVGCLLGAGAALAAFKSYEKHAVVHAFKMKRVSRCPCFFDYF